MPKAWLFGRSALTGGNPALIPHFMATLGRAGPQRRDRIAGDQAGIGADRARRFLTVPADRLRIACSRLAGVNPACLRCWWEHD